MSLQNAVVNQWVLPAAIPYIAIASYDFWLHESDRSVPKTEGLLHGVIITGVALFLVLATLGQVFLATLALSILFVAATFDELIYHGDLKIHEKRLHWFGGGALAFCVGVWIWTI